MKEQQLLSPAKQELLIKVEEMEIKLRFPLIEFRRGARLPVRKDRK